MRHGNTLAELLSDRPHVNGSALPRIMARRAPRAVSPRLLGLAIALPGIVAFALFVGRLFVAFGAH